MQQRGRSFVKLALVYHQFIGTGGLERYLQALARALQERGHQIEVITSRVDETGRHAGASLRMIDVQGAPKWKRLRVFADKAAAVGTDADLVLGFGRTWRQDAHRAGGGCHALYSRLLPWWKRWSRKNRLELRLERQLYTGGTTRHFVVNAAPVAAQLQRLYGVPAEKITVIHTAVDAAHFHPSPAGGPPPQRERPVLLFVSSNHRRKGLDALLRALKSVPGAELWIAGACLGWRHRLAAKVLAPQITLRELGEVADLAPIYRQADWFVHPTLYDACANTVLQSMASGLPGLISSADGASEFIRDGENGLLLREPSDSHHLAERLAEAFALPEARRQAFSANARATVLPLTWQAHVEKWEALFQRLK